MPRTLVIATRNPRKLEEIAAILGPLGVRTMALDTFADVPAVPETGETFEDNARTKALAYARATGEWTLADDSGLEVDVLDGRPGVRSSRWGGQDGNDRLNNETLMQALAAHPQEAWTARFRCVMALATPDRVLAVAEGACEGRITDRPAGSNGFGYDPHFYLPDLGRTMAQIPPELKNRLSHRAQALSAMKQRLTQLL